MPLKNHFVRKQAQWGFSWIRHAAAYSLTNALTLRLVNYSQGNCIHPNNLRARFSSLYSNHLILWSTIEILSYYVRSKTEILQKRSCFVKYANTISWLLIVVTPITFQDITYIIKPVNLHKSSTDLITELHQHRDGGCLPICFYYWNTQKLLKHRFN